MPAKAQAEETFEKFSAASNKAFKDGFEKAAAAFGEFNAFSKDNVDAFVASASTAGKSAEKINAEVAAYAKQTLETGVETAKKAATVKSMQELVELQSDYAKSSFETYVGEMTKLTDMCASSVKDAFKPLNKRVSAAVELMQTAR